MTETSDLASTPVSSNGHAPASAESVISEVRAKPRNVLLLRGFGPLVAGFVLFVLMLRLAPSVAPEQIVDVPVSVATTTTTTTTTTTAVPAP